MGKVKALFLAFIMFFSVFLLSGCWDKIELDNIFLATAIALDVGEEKEIKISFEVPKSSKNSSATNAGESENSNVILDMEADTIAEAISKLNASNSRQIFLKHCQLIIISTELAEKGLNSFLDFFVRDTQTRLEILVLLFQGKARDAFDVKPQQEASVSNYLVGIISDAGKSTKSKKVMLLNLLSTLLSEQKSSLLPVLAITEKGENKAFKLKGFGGFQKDKLEILLSEENAQGFNWTRAQGSNDVVAVKGPDYQANFYIDKIKAKQKIEIENQNQAFVTFQISMILGIAEVVNFDDLNYFNFVRKLEVLAKERIKEQVLEAFEVLKTAKIDAYGFGESIYKKDPKLWREIKESWKDIYSNARVNVKVETVILNNGHILSSIEMEQKENENR